MNESITAPFMTAGRSPLLRRIDGVELPTAGTWYVPGNHATIAFSRPRTLRRRQASSGRARGATLHVSDDPDQIALSVSLEASGIALGSAPCAPAGSPTRLEARAVGGRDPWRMSGQMFTATNVCAVSAALTYHGIWHGGRDDRDYAWFVLAGMIDVQQGRRQRQTQFSFHLLAYGPDDSPSAPEATCRAQEGSNTRSHMVPA